MNEKEKLTEGIAKAIQKAIKSGYKVAVASDPEGNNWNSINPDYMEYSDSLPKVIALGVFGILQDEEVIREYSEAELTEHIKSI